MRDDAISRTDIQNYIAKYLSQYLYEDVRQAVEVIDAYIGDMPSVQPSRKGHWIEHEKVYECSECQIIRAKGMTGKYNFCPSCGCRMEGREE